MTSDFKRIVLIYFSPTKTTKLILENIRKEIDINESLICDCTLPDNRLEAPSLNKNDLVFFGIPTYAGRIPNLILPFLKSIKGNGATAVPIVTFGNRNFDNSLFELKEVLKNNDFSFLGAAAFSTEHSFSKKINGGRPNEKDLEEAKSFARKLRSLEPKSDLNIPGNLDEGYFKPQDRNGNPISILKVKPKTKETCNNCKTCITVCPMGVINKDNPNIVNDPCIKCNACVRFCPKGAKYFDDEKYLYHVNELEFLYGNEEKNNIFFIS